MLVILMNAATIALEADYSLNPNAAASKVLDTLDMLDYIFFFIYFVEFLLKLYVHQYAFWKNASYVFECLILIIMLIQIIIAKGGMQQDDGSKVIVDILNIFKGMLLLYQFLSLIHYSLITQVSTDTQTCRHAYL